MANPLTRREALLGALTLAASQAVRAETAAVAAVAMDAGVQFGSAFDREVFSDAPYRALIAAECRAGALENSLKFDWLKPRGSKPDYTHADRLIDFAQTHGIALRGTALIWNDWEPDWLKALSRRDAAYVFDQHISETAGRFAGRIAAWDVVNEPFFPLHGRPGGFRKGVWFDALGATYVERAFRRAAAADPKALLILNEAFCEQNDAWGTAIRPLLAGLVRSLKDAGVRLDGVGFQGHLKPHLPHDYSAFADYLRGIAGLGATLHITELDVDDSSFPDAIPERDARVAETLTRFLDPVLRVARLRSVTLWHLSDRYSWYRSVPWYGDAVAKHGGRRDRKARSHVFDDQLRPKPAWAALRTAFEKARVR